jgi:hypothetical protein
MAGAPSAVRIAPAFVVVWSMEALPWTVEMPRRERAGWWAARRMAKASWGVLASCHSLAFQGGCDIVVMLVNVVMSHDARLQGNSASDGKDRLDDDWTKKCKSSRVNETLTS